MIDVQLNEPIEPFVLSDDSDKAFVQGFGTGKTRQAYDDARRQVEAVRKVEAMRAELLEVCAAQGLSEELLDAVRHGSPESVVRSWVAAKPHIEAYRRALSLHWQRLGRATRPAKVPTTEADYTALAAAEARRQRRNGKRAAK